VDTGFHESAPARPRAAGTAYALHLSRLTGQFIVLGLLVITPWFFGGVEATTQVWLYGASIVALVCSLVIVFLDRQSSLRLPIAFIPLVLAVLLGVFQLIPLERSWQSRLTPAAVSSQDALRGDSDELTETWRSELALEDPDSARPISLYPASTRHDLALLVLGINLFFLGSVLFANPRTHLWLLGLVMANGAAITFFGLTQKLSWNGLLYWSVPLTQGGSPFGPFVNKNNAGGYLILCFAAGIGVTVWCLQRYLPSRFLRGFAEFRGAWKALTRRLLEVIAALNARTLAAITATGFLAAGIFSTLSRGASLAALGATFLAVVAVRVSRRKNVSIGPLVVVIVLGVALIGWAGMLATVEKRIATLWDTEIQEFARVQHWRHGFQAAQDYWLLGSGLGTYRYVYRQYQHEMYPHLWFRHAENQYLEALVDGGVVGLSCLLAALILVIAATWRLLRWDPDPRSAVFAIACTVAIAGQAITAFFDFGLYIPANMLLFAVLCGAVAGRAASIPRKDHEITHGTTPWRRVMMAIVATCLILGSWWGLSELRFTARYERAAKAIRVQDVLNEFSAEAIEPHIESLTELASLQSDNAELQRRLGELWIQRYRAFTLQEVRERTEYAIDDPNDTRLYQLTLPMVIHQQVHFLTQLRLTEELEKMRQRTAVRENLLPAMKHLVISRDACPFLPEVHSGLAQLCGLVEAPSLDQIHIDRMMRLASADPTLVYACGLMQQHAGRFEEARACWKQSLSLSPRHLDNVLDLADPWLTNVETIRELLPDSPKLMVDLARRRFTEEEQQTVRLLLLDRAEELLAQTPPPEAERFYLAAAALAIRGNYQEAFTNYAQAVRREPENLEWRYEYAKALHGEKQWQEARKQALWCVRLAPDVKKYQQLLEAINRVSLAAPSS
jgi:O-antigen ligase/tetratricopeptide (TPR) repeat protein